MKTHFKTIILIIAVALIGQIARAEENKREYREVDSFSEISLRVAANVYLDQGQPQSVEVVGKASTLEDLITEVKGRELIIRFPNKNYLFRDFNAGKIDIYITVPEIDALNLAGSGDIICEGPINSRILNLAISGSGDILMEDLQSDRVKASISGSGDIQISGSEMCTDLNVSISGSGDFKGIDFPVEDVVVRIAGSGGASVVAENNLNVRVAGSGDVVYKGSPLVDQAIVGSGDVKRY